MTRRGRQAVRGARLAALAQGGAARTLGVLLWTLAACDAPEARGSACVSATEAATSRQYWRDAEGRVVIHRGLNVSGSAKWSMDKLAEVSEADFAVMASWGVSAVRLLVFWQAIEPSPGAYDTDYLEKVRAQVALAGAHGLAVVLDLHQDLFGEGFGSTGFPRWACDEALYASYTQPPLWFLGYLTREVSACFDRFWESPALQDAYADAVGALLQVVRDEPAVMGVELINEPFWGTYPHNDFEPLVLQPFYERVVARLGLAHTGPRVLAEPSVAHNLGLGSALSRPFGCGERSWIYAPHFYPSYAELGEPYTGELESIRAALDDMEQKALELHAPWALTEFGMRNNAPGVTAYLRDVFTALDERFAAAFVWDYDKRGDGNFALLEVDGTPRDVAWAVMRPYAHRVAGEPLAQTFDAEHLGYTLVWRATSVATPTIVKVPPLVYASGVDVTTTAASYSLVGSELSVVAGTLGEHTLTLTPRP